MAETFVICIDSMAHLQQCSGDSSWDPLGSFRSTNLCICQNDKMSSFYTSFNQLEDSRQVKNKGCVYSQNLIIILRSFRSTAKRTYYWHSLINLFFKEFQFLKIYPIFMGSALVREIWKVRSLLIWIFWLVCSLLPCDWLKRNTGISFGEHPCIT